ncbi:hypothetical protein A0U89_07030 [Kozakia baliensis]|uniref:Portal protein n=2 Tax=Kozakia baliensis TaxID=153496 RepID=A0A1D8UTF8_9PROT|nr:hypothetical protein A0U89_07030 [Kozakia baliensis]
MEPTFSMPSRQKDVGTSTQPSLGMLAAFGGMMSNTGTPVTPFTSLRSASVYGCVNRLGQDIAKLPLGVRQKLPSGEGYRPRPNHPLMRLLRRPNNWMTPYQFMRYMVSCIQLRGNAYAAILRNPLGDPVELIPISPDRVNVQVSVNGLVFYDFSHPLIGDGLRWHAEDILHFKNMCVDGGYVGLSPIAFAQDTMGLAIAAQEQAAILFRQGNQTGGILSTEKQLGPELTTQIANEVARQYSGVQNSSKPMVLGGGFKYERMSITPDEAQFLESRKFSVEEICRIFGVPPHKIQHIVGGTFANIENQEQAYINDALQPIATEVEQEQARKLFFEDEIDEGLEIFFDFRALLRGDMKTRFEAYSIGMQTGFMNGNEARANEGLGPVEGGEIYRFPLNTAPIKPASPPPTGAPGDQAPAVEDTPPIQPEETE